jgi:NADH-quinone oxidoreductase subunit D
MFDLISFENITLNTINSSTELNTIETLINHFNYILSPYNITENFHYSAVEAGKGEFGVFLTTTVEMQPYRVYLRSPAFNHLQLIGLLCSGHLFADVITIIGTLDLVFGEIDR